MPDIKGARDLSTEQGNLAEQIRRTIAAHDLDETFRILGRYMDKHDLTISRQVINEFEFADRVSDA